MGFKAAVKVTKSNGIKNKIRENVLTFFCEFSVKSSSSAKKPMKNKLLVTDLLKNRSTCYSNGNSPVK